MARKHDKTFQKIFREEKNITCFFDAFFGFLYRCTDFYTVTDGRPPVGYPPGISRDILLSLYEKWKREKENEKENEKEDEKKSEKKPESAANVSSSRTMNDDIASSNAEANSKANRSAFPYQRQATKRFVDRLDWSNGAVHDTYHWRQSSTHCNVTVLVPPHVLGYNDLEVRLDSRKIQVKVDDKVLLSGTFPHAIKSDVALWFVDPGKKVDIHIDKVVHGAWDRLLEHESPIPKAQVDGVDKPYESPTEEEEMMQLEDIMRNQRLMEEAAANKMGRRNM